MNNDTRYFVCADGIRGLACLIVLISHAVTMFFLNLSPFFAGSGKIGVCLFFVLSAFLLTRKLIGTGFSASELLQYGISRFLRIMPLYLFALIIYKFMGTTDISSWRNVLDSLFLTQGYAHFWTVPVEFKFYFYLPLLAYFFVKSSLSKPLLSLLCFVILILTEQFLWPYWLIPINSIHISDYLAPFTTGVFFAAFYDRLKQYVTSTNASWIAVGTAIICIISLPITKKYFFKIPLDLSLAHQFVHFGFLWVIFIVFTIQGKGFVGKVLSSYLFRTMGKWSFSIYLFHWLVYMKYIQFWPNQIVAMLMAFVSAILVGGVVYYFVEQPIQQLRQLSKTFLEGYKGWRFFLAE